MNLHPDGPHLLDTSAVIRLKHRRLVASAEAFVSFATLGELSVGVFRSNDITQSRASITAVLRFVQNLMPTEQTAIYYGRIIVSLQRIGRPIPVNDVWIAAIALEHDLPLLADDAHFARVPGLRYIPIR